MCKGTVILVAYSLTFHVLSKHLFLFPIIIFIIITLPLENLSFLSPRPKGLGDIAMSLASIRLSLRMSICMSIHKHFRVAL